MITGVQWRTAVSEHFQPTHYLLWCLETQSDTSKFWIPGLDFPSLWECPNTGLKCISSADVFLNTHLSLHAYQRNRDTRTTAEVWFGESLQFYLDKKPLPLPLLTPPRSASKTQEILALSIMVHRGENSPSSSDRPSSTSAGTLDLV